MTINFNLKKTSGYYQLFLILRHRGEVIRKYSGFTLQLNEWDKNRQRAKGERASIINSYISERISRLDSYVDDCVRANKEPRPGEAIQIIEGSVMAHTAKTLRDAFDLYLQRIENIYDTDTKSKYTVLRDQVEEYERHKKRKVYMQDVNEDFYLDLIKFLIEERGNKNRTIKRKITRIKTVMGYAVKSRKIFKGYDWDVTVDLKIVDVNRVPLTQEERDKFWGWTTTDMFERRIIDAFIFSVYTGLRWSDVEQLSSHHFFKTDAGEHFIDLSLEKGDKEHMVGVPMFVYERFKHYIGGKGPIFKLTDNQTCNDVLKRTAKALELTRPIEWREKQGSKTIKEVYPLWKKISFHFARYTYTRLLDDSGIQATWIQKNLRHSKFSTTEKYLKADDIKRINGTNNSIAI